MATRTLPTTDADSPWKEALDHFLPRFLAFFFPDIYKAIDWKRGYQALDKEFQQIVRGAEAGRVLADKLYKVWRKNGEETWLLIHVEIQGQPEGKFARRMFDYNVRAFQLYNRPVVSLAVLCDDQPGWRPRQFSQEVWGCRLSLEFPMVKLLDYEADLSALEEHENPFAQVVLAHLKARQTRHDPARSLRVEAPAGARIVRPWLDVPRRAAVVSLARLDHGSTERIRNAVSQHAVPF